MSIFIFRFVFVYIILAVLSEHFSELSKLRHRISFRKRFLLQTHSGTSCTTEAKELFKVCLWAKILLSIVNSTSKCSAQNLGSKVTNRRRGSFPRGHDQRSQFQIFSNMCCLVAYWSFTKILCYLLFSISVVIGQFSSKWPGSSSRTVSPNSTKQSLICALHYHTAINHTEITKGPSKQRDRPGK